MGYVHVEIEQWQNSKKPGLPCGDVIDYDRTPHATTIILSDGMGSGIKAHIAATMCVARLKELLRCGFSLRESFARMARTMNEAAKSDMPYAVFSVARVLNDGITSILSYEMPSPILISKKYSTILNQRKFTVENSVIGEANCHLSPQEAILMVSDGITQAGIGRGLNYGWEIEGVNKFIGTFLREHKRISELPQEVFSRAHELCGGNNDDDASAVLAYCRMGTIVNVFTGPPSDSKLDRMAVERFIQSEGIKIVCGATTAKIVARYTGKKLNENVALDSGITPPCSQIDGIDLVTEGAMTLNQLLNVADEERSELFEKNPVTDLYDYMIIADRVNFFVGCNHNPASDDITFRQMGLIKRRRVVDLLAEKLREAGKLVVIEHF